VAWAAEVLGGEADVLLLDARRLSPDPRAAGSWVSLVRPGGLVAILGGPADLRSEIVASFPRRLRKQCEALPGARVLFLGA
jgi:tRNA(Met) C34 N-acetyltransferase TmcA